MRRLEAAYDFEEGEDEPSAVFNPTATLEEIKFAFNAFARVHKAAEDEGDEGGAVM